jgi:hypothetical protein
VTLAGLPVRVERIALTEIVGRGGRRSVLVRMAGAGEEGAGEDVTHDAPDRAAFLSRDPSPLLGVRTLGGFAEALDAWDDLDRDIAWPVVRSYRRWALESAALDLALRQAGTALPAALGVVPGPLRTVVSLRPDDAAPVRALLDAHPGTRLKLDARVGWTAETTAALAATGAVDILDLKGTAPGSSVHEPGDPDRYLRLADAFPGVLFEDPDPGLAHLLPRVAWDEPVHGVADLDALPPAEAVNVKPCRVGSLAGVLDLVEACRARGVGTYSGGHTEIGPGRGQARLVAALLHPDAPNDLAPLGGPEARPATPPADLRGFRWGWPGPG